MLSVTEAPADSPPADPEPLTRKSVLLRLVAHATWIVLLAGAVVTRVGRFGFSPTDQGFVLTLSRRLLQGDVPHVDFVSARPLGSAVLHLVDHALPGPLFVASGFVTTVEVIVATVACAALLTRTSPLRWGPLRTGLVAAAAVANLHVFTMMAWHTIDGIFLTAVGWWLLDAGLRAESAWSRRIGLFLLGFAVMTKQSFMFAVPAGALLLLLHPAQGIRGHVRDLQWWRRAVVDLLCLGAFPLGYAAVVTAAGGLGEMILQLTDGTGTTGANLYAFWWADGGPGDIRPRILLAAGCALVAVAAVVAAAVSPAVAGRRATGWAGAAGVAGIAGVAVVTLVESGLQYAGVWSVTLLWILLAAIVLDAVVHRHVPWRPLLIALLAYMTSLSWGYQVPNLLSGTLVLTTLEIAVRALPARPRSRLARLWSVAASAVAGVLAVVLTGSMMITTHDRATAIDRPRAELTEDLGDAAPALRWIRTNPSTAKYVGQIRECLREHPASRVAVLPDNAFAYTAFDLRNPFPNDWPLPLELVGGSGRLMLDAADALDRDGDYLVLFQTVGPGELAAEAPVPDAVAPDAPILSRSGLEEVIRSELDGVRISCGSFVGVWSPRR